MERIGQTVIRCGNCGYENNTDLVGAINIKTKKNRNKLLDEIEMEYRRKKRKKSSDRGCTESCHEDRKNCSHLRVAKKDPFVRQRKTLLFDEAFSFFYAF